MLRTEHIQPYKDVHHYQTEQGYIVWRYGTGGNCEILHLRATVIRQGVGRHLLKTMLERLQANPPYATVFGFTRSLNKSAIMFYKAMGFQTSKVDGVYRDGSAIVFSQTYEKLKELHLADNS